MASAQSRTHHSSSSVPEINPAITSLSSSALTNAFVANRARNEGKLQRIEFELCDPNFPHSLEHRFLAFEFFHFTTRFF